MALKKPSELFEQRRLESLAKESVEKEEGQVKDKKIVSPKELFGDMVEVEEAPIIEQIVEELVEVNPYLEEIEVLRKDLEKISDTIPEETDLTEVYQNIDNIKNRIDNLPKQKSYDEDIHSIREELVRIEGSIPVPEIFDPSDLYENISLLRNKLEEVRSEIPTIPEPILYDYQLDQLKEMVVDVRNSIPVVPEIRYYEDELNQIISAIEEVRSEIPVVPEIKYYDNEISAIESRLVEIQESIPTVKYYDDELDVLNKNIANVKESIPVVPEVKYYDEDVKELKEEIDSVKKSIPEVKYYDEDVKELKEEIDSVKKSIPEVKYYDEDIKDLNEEVKELYNKVLSIKIPDQDKYKKEVEDLYSSFEEKNHRLLEKINYLEEVFEKFNEETLTEGLLNEPPEIENSDPLTPLDQKFVTLDQLQEHYRLFINRIQQQLSTLGGGGETRLKYLDDIVGIATNASAYDGKVLSYNHSIGKFEFITGGGGGNAAITISDTPPANPQPGNLWYDSVHGRIFIYYQDVDGSQWVDASPSGGPITPNYWISTNAGIHTLSSVGIGTTNPIAKLEVIGNIVGTSGSFIGTHSGASVLNIPTFTDSNPTNQGILGVGRTVGFEDTNIIAHFTDDVDSYSQVIVQNHNAGTTASADFIVNNNQEDGVQYYGDFGINGSNFIPDPNDAFSDPNGVYLYSAGGSLTIGSQDQVPIKFAVNYTEVARVVETGVGIGTTNPTAKLDVRGGDIRVGVNTSEGVILTSPNGTKYRLVVNDSGVLSTVLVP